MPRRTVGPLPLTGGLQLDPPTGRPNGLLDALNVEEREGYLCTRRAVAHLVSWRGSSVSADVIGGGSQPALSIEEGGDWTVSGGLTQVHIGFTNMGTVPEDEFVLFPLVDNNSSGSSEPGSITWEYFGDDDDWHALEVGFIMPSASVFFPPPGAINSNENPYLWFRMPRGWQNAMPSGTTSTRYWLRVTFDVAMTSTDVVVGFNFGPRAPGMQDITLFGGGSFEVEGRRVRLFAFKRASGDDTFAIPRFDAIDPSSSALRSDELSQTQPRGNGDVPINNILADVDADTFRMLHVPAARRLLIYSSAGWIEMQDRALGFISHSLWTAQQPNIDWSGRPLEPLDKTDTDYEDILTEGFFPGASAATVYAGRVFFAEAGTPNIRWTAPDEFVTILPSANIYRMNGNGAGSVIAMEVLHGQLYIFTKTSIWRASLIDPVPGQESAVSFQFVVGVGCTSHKSIVATEDFIFFLSPEGVRAFDGQRSRVISTQVEDLFRDGSQNTFAVRRPSTAVGVYDPVEGQYLLFYSSSGAIENDTCLVIDVRAGNRCWIWGADLITGNDIPADGNGPFVNRPWSIMGTVAFWDEQYQKVVVGSRRGLVGILGGDAQKDFSVSPVRARAESHHIGLGQPMDQRVVEMHVTVGRETQGTMKVSSIADGRRVDTRTLSPQLFGADADAVLGSAPLSSAQALLEERRAQAPLVWRGSHVGRNHRVLLESNAPNHDPLKVAAITVDVEPA